MNDCTIIDSPLRYSSRRVFMPWVPLGAEEYALEFRVLGISPADGIHFFVCYRPRSFGMLLKAGL